MIESCQGCLGVFESLVKEMPLHHPYIGSSYACWQVYGDVLAREFSDKTYFDVHRLTVDSYAAQHVGDQTDRRARQSVNLHLIALYLYHAKNIDFSVVKDFLKKATATKYDWPVITQIIKPNWLTVNDMIPAKNASEHALLVKQWARSVWEAYEDSHADIIKTYERWRDISP